MIPARPEPDTRKSKQSFLENKERRSQPVVLTAMTKVFCFFFSKKKALLLSSTSQIQSGLVVTRANYVIVGPFRRGDAEATRLPCVACPDIPGLPRREGAARNDGCL
jgi:hypothetical protein